MTDDERHYVRIGWTAWCQECNGGDALNWPFGVALHDLRHHGRLSGWLP